ncbi:unnamed protein product [Onchocerca ochengi]|uniref:Copine domain-containing protein n=1 Tax=Onchocerca ochengi TaxID=42157 RepID=A0A182EGJ0_ONCOC|nr:unnamed protein product [Onchocerca ochengi]
MEDIVGDDLCSAYRVIKRAKRQVKLVIVFAGDHQRTGEKVEDRASITARILRNTLHIPICIVAQSDTREKKRLRKYKDSSVLFFRGSDMHASTLVINTTDEAKLKETFLNWKKKLHFLENHQIIAFHFTMINGTEPENSEQIFR